MVARVVALVKVRIENRDMISFVTCFFLGGLMAFGLFCCALRKRDKRWKKIIVDMQIKHIKNINQLKEFYDEG